jgi:hypothetical protein
MGQVKIMAPGNTGKGMELVMKLVGILIPGLEMARYVFGIDTSQQNRSLGFVFKDKISKGFYSREHLLWNLLPDNKASSPLLFTPSCQVLVLS